MYDDYFEDAPAIDSKSQYSVKRYVVDNDIDVLRISKDSGLDVNFLTRLQQEIKQHITLSQGDNLILELQKIDKFTVNFIKALIETPEQKLELILSANQKTFIPKLHRNVISSGTRLISGRIDGSFYSSARRAGANAGLIKEFIALLSHSIDFQRDIKVGDTFKILYDTDAKKMPILYVGLQSKSSVNEAFRYKLSSGKVEYFDANGKGVRKSLLRTPINGAKISSGYGMRNHPVFGYSKMHQGVDFSAPRGTPILAAGDGVVKRKLSHGRGYGNFIEIEHNKTHSTLYAHMSKFANINVGSRVKQGQIIGYVGNTGTATGPHLHYEVIVNGAKVNPAKVSMPRNQDLAGNELKRFKKSLNSIEKLVAANDNKSGKMTAIIKSKS